MERVDQLRAAERAGEAVQRGLQADRPLPRAARVRRLPRAPQAGRRGGRRGGPLRRDRQGLRVRPRPVRDPVPRRAVRALDPKKTRAIEIQDFVDLDEIDPIYFEHPYYLGPDKGAEKAYALLVQAMDEARKVAVARFVLRNKEHLAAIRPMGDLLTMATMRFADEVVDPERARRRPARAEADQAGEARAGDGRAADRIALDRASTPASTATSTARSCWRCSQQKADGKEVVSAPSEEPTPTKAPDLMAALEESLAAVRAEDGGKPEPTQVSSQVRLRGEGALDLPLKGEADRGQGEGRPGQGEVVSAGPTAARAPRARRPGQVAPGRGDEGHRRRPSAEADQPRQDPLPGPASPRAR